MMYLETIKNFLHTHQPMHPADAVFFLFAVLFILIPAMICLYTLFLLVMGMLRDLMGA